MTEIIKGKYIYKLCDEEENSYYTYISTNIECGRLIGALVNIHKDRYMLPNVKDENYNELSDSYLLSVKQGLNDIKELFENSNDFDHKAEDIVANMCEYYDDYGNTEEYVFDTLKELGVDVHYEDIRTFYY